MTVSVIIPTVLRSAAVGRSVAAASESAARLHPDAEVLLVVNGAGHTEAPPAAPNVRVIRSAATGVSAARNDGVAQARHDTILFTDDDLVVPPDWCAAMSAPLRDGTHAVAAPVRMTKSGPVTAYLDHERAFDATPLTAATARALVTANAGYRRDLVPGAPFDAERYPDFAEDTNLGLRIREAGGTIRWLGGAAKPEHEVEEELASVVRRALRQGVGTVQTYLHRRIIDYYYPTPLAVYETLAAGRISSPRRYTEIADPAARTVFAGLSLLRQAAQFAGYLDGLGAAYGTPLIEIDEPAFIAGLTSVFETLADQAGETRWDSVPVRFQPVTPSAAPVVPDSFVTGFARVLAAAAPVVPGAVVPPPAGGDDLAWLAWDAAARDRLALVWRGFGRTEPAEDEVERAIRAAGIAFGRGCLIRERYTGSRVKQWPGAAPVPAARESRIAAVPTAGG